VGGKADWLAHGLPREGETAGTRYAGELADRHPPTCPPDTPLSGVARRLADSSYGYCLVVNEHGIVLGRIRRSQLAGADPASLAGDVMEPGPSTVRPSTPARQLAERLAEQGLQTAILTTPAGALLGVFHRSSAADLAPDESAS